MSRHDDFDRHFDRTTRRIFGLALAGILLSWTVTLVIVGLIVAVVGKFMGWW